MPPFVPDGLYKIRNVEFSRDVSGFTEGASGPGAILGYIDRPGKNNALWKIKNVGGGGNEIVIESFSAPGNFASAAQLSNARLFGSPAQTVWTVVKEDSGYYLQSPNAEFVWKLTRDGDFAQIVLIPFTGQNNTQWTFDRVGN